MSADLIKANQLDLDEALVQAIDIRAGNLWKVRFQSVLPKVSGEPRANHLSSINNMNMVIATVFFMKVQMLMLEPISSGLLQ